MSEGWAASAGNRPADVQLPPVDADGGAPLMQALRLRASGRRFDSRPLPASVLGNLLWAANGVNRPDTGRRTAPSAVNWQEIDLYVALPEAVYRYEPRAHRLEGVLAGDLRAACGVHSFVGEAPVVLIYVADLARMKGADEDGRRFYPPCDTGFVSQNVYLYCASEGLVTVALVSVDKPVLHRRLGLGPEQAVMLTQPVGFPGTRA